MNTYYDELKALVDQANKSFTLGETKFQAVLNDGELCIIRDGEKLFNFLPVIEEEHVSIDFLERTHSLKARLYFSSGCSEAFELSVSELACQDILYKKLGFSAHLVVTNNGSMYFREVILSLTLSDKGRKEQYLYTGFDQSCSRYIIEDNSIITGSYPVMNKAELQEALRFIMHHSFNVISSEKAIALFCISIFSIPKSLLIRFLNIFPNFLPLIIAPTGSFKTSLGKATLSVFHPDRIDIAFDSTFAAFDYTLKNKRDIPCIFDDFRIRKTRSENADFQKKLELLLRSTGDFGGGRTKCVGSKAQNFICECTPIVTGEALSTELRSSSARIFALEIEKDEVCLEHLSAIQAEPQHLQTFFKAYIQYIINSPSFIEAVSTFYKYHLNRFRSSVKDIHGRHQETAAWILTGFFMGYDFISNSGYFSAEDLTQYKNNWKVIYAYMVKYLKTQSALTGSGGRMQRIMKALSLLLENGEILLPDSFFSAGSKARRVNSSPAVIGFVENNKIYLNTDKISAVVSEYFLKNGSLDYYFSSRELRCLLKENNLIPLKSLKSGSLTRLVSVNGKRSYYTPIERDLFFRKLKEGEKDNEKE